MTGLIKRLQVRITGRLALKYPKPIDREDAALDQEAIDRIRRLEGVVRQCGERFRRYEESHRAKLTVNQGEATDDIVAKVRLNMEMAELCEIALVEPEGDE